MRAAAVLLLAFLLSGCAAAADRPPLRAAPVTLQAPESEGYPGLVVRGSIAGTPEGLRVEAVARNTGERTYQVETGCGSPWGEALFRGNDSVDARQPLARCAAFALRDFAPGDELPFAIGWDGLVWDPDAGRMVTALPGDYTWSVRFVAYPAQAFAAKRFDLDFEVTVLPE